MMNKIKTIWKQYNIGFYGGVAGSFFMGTLHLVATCISFSWLTFNYMLFCYLMMLIRVLIWFIDKTNHSEKAYIIGSISLIFVLIPLTVSLVKTITDKELTIYIFDWIIYAYALFAFAKLIIGIVNLSKSKGSSNTKNVLCWLTLVNALFTMFMLEFTMIRTFSSSINESLIIIEYAFQGCIIAFVLYIVVMFFVRYLRIKRKSDPISPL